MVDKLDEVGVIPRNIVADTDVSPDVVKGSALGRHIATGIGDVNPETLANPPGTVLGTQNESLVLGGGGGNPTPLQILAGVKGRWGAVRDAANDPEQRALGTVPVYIVPDPAIQSSELNVSRPMHDGDSAQVWMQSSGTMRITDDEHHPFGSFRPHGGGTVDSYVGWADDIRYEIDLPVGAADSSGLLGLTRLPLTAALAAEVPAGSRAVLSGKGFVGMLGTKHRDEKGGPRANAEHNVNLQIDWLDTGKVRVSMLFENRRDLVNELLGGSNELRPSLFQRVIYDDLDLSDPDDRLSYEKILRLEVKESGAKRDIQREGRQFNLPLSGSGVVVDFSEIAVDDDLVAKHPRRSKISADVRAANEKISWFEVTGGFELETKNALMMAVDAAAHVSAGISGKAAAYYTMLWPRTAQIDETISVGQARKNAAEAVQRFYGAVVKGRKDPGSLEMPIGTRLVLHGEAEGSLVLRALGLVEKASAGGLAAAAVLRGGVNLAGRRGTKEVALEWLEDGTISVEVRDTSTSFRRLWLRADLGYDSDREEIEDAARPRSLAEWRRNGGTEAKWKELLDIEIELLWRRDELDARQSLVGFFDPNDAADRDAMAELFSVNPFSRAADPHADPLLSTFTTQKRRLPAGAQVDFLGVEFWENRTEIVDRQRSLVTRTGEAVHTNEHSATHDVDTVSSRIFTESDMRVDLVHYEVTPELQRAVFGDGNQPEGLEDGRVTFLAAKLELEDPRTRLREAEFYVRLFPLLGADINPDQIDLTNRRAVIPKLFSGFGRSELKIELYFSEPALEALTKANPREVELALAQMWAATEPDRELPAWLDPERRALAEAYYRAIYDRPHSVPRNRWRMSLMRSYAREVGGSLLVDERRHRLAQGLVRWVDSFGDDAFAPSQLAGTFGSFSGLVDELAGEGSKEYVALRSREARLGLLGALSVLAGKNEDGARRAALISADFRADHGPQIRYAGKPPGDKPPDVDSLIDTIYGGAYRVGRVIEASAAVNTDD